MQRGGSSKDTWVLSTGPVSTVQPAASARSGRRTWCAPASTCPAAWWRTCTGSAATPSAATTCARLLRVALLRVIEESPAERARAWPGIVGLLRHTGILAEEDAGADEAAVARILRNAVVDDAKPGLAGDLKQLLRVASQLRERLSLDNWRTLNHMTRRLERSRGRQIALSEALAELDRDIAAFITLSGFALDGMTRDHGWRFLSIGRRIERLQFLCGTAAAGAARARRTPTSAGCSSSPTRASPTARATWRARNGCRCWTCWCATCSNPRSIAFQLKGLHDFLGRIEDAYGEGVEERLRSAVMALEAIDPGADLQHGSARLAALLRGVARGLVPALGTARPALLLPRRRSQPADVCHVMRDDARVIHETVYSYESPVVLSQQLLHLTPRALRVPGARARTASRSSPRRRRPSHARRLLRQPGDADRARRAASSLAVRAESQVTVQPRARAGAARARPPWEMVRDRLRAAGIAALLEPAQFLFESTHIECFRDLARYAAPELRRRAATLLEAVLDLTRAHPRRFHVRPEGDQRVHAARARCSPGAAACARTSPTS